MIDPIQQSVAAPAALGAAQLHRLALNDALNSLAPVEPSSQPTPGQEEGERIVASLNLDSTVAALHSEAISNQRAINKASAAEVALGRIVTLLGNARHLLSHHHGHGTNKAECNARQLNIDSIVEHVDRIATKTTFAGESLLDGAGVIQATGRRLTIASFRPDQLGTTINNTTYSLRDIASGGRLCDAEGANASATQVVNAAMNQVQTERSRVDDFAKFTLRPQLAQFALAADHLSETASLIRSIGDDSAIPSDVPLDQATVGQSTGASPYAAPPAVGSILSIRA